MRTYKDELFKEYLILQIKDYKEKILNKNDIYYSYYNKEYLKYKELYDKFFK